MPANKPTFPLQKNVFSSIENSFAVSRFQPPNLRFGAIRSRPAVLDGIAGKYPRREFSVFPWFFS
jgi:hypothetical protein